MKYHENPPNELSCFMPTHGQSDRHQTADGRTEMTKLVAFRNFERKLAETATFWDVTPLSFVGVY
jgi:hypothetical protein